jgi:dimethylaniline monooxygenase (N-oxide forming)
MKRIIIVGAGPCGLVALKGILEAGHDTILFERSAALGGIFARTATYPNLHLTIYN